LVFRREPRELEGGVPTGAVLGSLSLHSVVLAGMLWGATRIDIPDPLQVYQVQLIAAPRSTPMEAVPAPEEPRPAPEREAARRPLETRTAPDQSAQRQTPPAPTREAGAAAAAATVVERPPAAPPEQSAQGVEGSPVRLEGAPFPYPEYLANIILQIKRHWRPPQGGRQLRAELAFTIRRDGSVADVVWVRRSGDPAFDLEARGAIESAGRRGVFGALPDGYPSDHLRVSFFFDPTRY
jgi:outer membrane biosynthesis protein TonB